MHVVLYVWAFDHPPQKKNNVWAFLKVPKVKGWRGLHVFHFEGSLCSRKCRVFLAEKGLPWESHLVNLAKGEQQTDWYLGINPRGLVPALVHDGKVHIESNDIMLYLDEAAFQ